MGNGSQCAARNGVDEKVQRARAPAASSTPWNKALLRAPKPLSRFRSDTFLCKPPLTSSTRRHSP